MVLELVRQAIDGGTYSGMAAWLDESGVPTPLDADGGKPRQDQRQRRWLPETVKHILTSPNLTACTTVRDEKTRQLHVVRNADGLPLRFTDAPLVDDETYARLQQALSKRTRTASDRKGGHLLHRVAYCAIHGDALYGWKKMDRKAGYYRCMVCRSYIRMDDLEDLAVMTFLDQVGDVEVMDRRYVPGEDHSAELSDVYAALEDVRAERDGGEYSYTGGMDDYRKRTARLSARLAELEVKPSRPAGFELVPTGETFGEKWEQLDAQGRRRLMLGAGYEVRASRTAEGFTFSFRMDPELAARVQAVAAGAPVSVPDHAELQAAYELSRLIEWAGENAPERPESEWSPVERAQVEAMRRVQAEFEQRTGHTLQISIDLTPQVQQPGSSALRRHRLCLINCVYRGET